MKQVFATLVITLVTAFLENAAADGDILFNRDIRPILSENCFACHGPDENARKAKFRLDLEETAKEDRGGYKAIQPGAPQNSELVKRITSSEPDEIMPPPEFDKELTETQKRKLIQWIEQGAVWQGHWAYIPPKKASVPEVQSDRPINPIDHFVIAKLESHDLQPSEQADRRTLIRRLSLDLTGLPPTRNEVADFLNDKSPDAYEKLVDQLLESPHYGERMAVPWLDVVRYADTVGYHGDQNQNIFPYRTYVIDAFNDNKPFDQFTIEQLAGDLLPNPTEEQLVASGFNRLNMMTREGGAQPEEYLAKYGADRVRTVSTTWLGSTMACAECHDHKYDPFTMKDFYSMKAFFADLKQWGVYADYNYTPNTELDGFGNDHPFPPEMKVGSPYLKRRIQKLQGEVEDLIGDSFRSMSKDKSASQSFEAWCENLSGFLELRPDGWYLPSLVSHHGTKGTKAQLLEDQSVLFQGKPQSNESLKLELQLLPGAVSMIRLEVLPHEQHEGKVARGNKNSFSLELKAFVRHEDKESEKPVDIFYAEANHREAQLEMGQPVLGVHRRWKSDASNPAQTHVARYWFSRPVFARHGDRLVVQLESSDVGRVRIAATPLTSSPTLDPIPGGDLREVLEIKPAERSLAERQKLFATYFQGGLMEDPFPAYLKLQEKIIECRDGKAFTMVSASRKAPRTTRILPRGNWQDDSGEIVEPQVPHFLNPIEEADHRLTRLDLARWIVSRENPLTARVFMNRLWKQFFGIGLSSVLDDLGAQGEWPTHPALLDWLAVEFMDREWNVKEMVKLIVMSHTYRQTSEVSKEQFERDPNNRLFARQSPRRLPAEFVRDNALAISGRLNKELGGPSARPYQPDGYYGNLNFPKREYEEHTDERQYRRGVYMHWQRTFLHPMLANFDAPSREECTADRVVSNTPQQALTLLNDPTFVETARIFAESLLQEYPGAGFDSRVDAAFQRALARGPKPAERDSLRQFYERQLSHLKASPEHAREMIRTGLKPVTAETNPVELAAWTSVCRVVLNLHETITRY